MCCCLYSIDKLIRLLDINRDKEINHTRNITLSLSLETRIARKISYCAEQTKIHETRDYGCIYSPKRYINKLIFRSPYGTVYASLQQEIYWINTALYSPRSKHSVRKSLYTLSVNDPRIQESCDLVRSIGRQNKIELKNRYITSISPLANRTQDEAEIEYRRIRRNSNQPTIKSPADKIRSIVTY